jgi:hypothetical protein
MCQDVTNWKADDLPKIDDESLAIVFWMLRRWNQVQSLAPTLPDLLPFAFLLETWIDPFEGRHGIGGAQGDERYLPVLKVATLRHDNEVGSRDLHLVVFLAGPEVGREVGNETSGEKIALRNFDAIGLDPETAERRHPCIGRRFRVLLGDSRGTEKTPQPFEHPMSLVQRVGGRLQCAHPSIGNSNFLDRLEWNRHVILGDRAGPEKVLGSAIHMRDSYLRIDAELLVLRTLRITHFPEVQVDG